MLPENKTISVLPNHREEHFCWETVPLITCRMAFPLVSGPGKGPGRIDRYYRKVEAALLRRLRAIHPRFCALARQAEARALPLPFSLVEVRSEEAWQDERFLSLHWTLLCDREEYHHCDLWALPWGTPYPVLSLLPQRLHKAAKQAPCLLRADGVWQVLPQEERLLCPFSAPEDLPSP